MKVAAFITDQELLDSMKLDDEPAFARLFNRYWEPLCVAAAKRLGQVPDVQDIVQEIMKTVWEKRHSLHTNEEGSLEGYLFTLLKYAIIDTISRDSKMEVRKNVFQQFVSLQESSVFEGLITKELDAAIQEEISGMPQNMKKVILLSRSYNYSIPEIAIQLSLSEQTVKNLLSQALKRLKTRVSHYYRHLPASHADTAFIIIGCSILGF